VCGSIRTREVKSVSIGWLIARLLRQRLVDCGRCGWRGRVSMVRKDGKIRVRRRRVAGPDNFASPSDQRELDLAELDKAMDKGNKGRGN
jgi:hypothetical protein